MLLLYCISEDIAEIDSDRLLGVEDAPVQSSQCDGIRCFFSEGFTPDSSNISRHALQFWNVINSIFHQTTIIPMRFPATVEDSSSLERVMSDFSKEYLVELERLRGLVQMKFVIQAAGPPPSPAERVATSGTEYLNSRQKASALVQSTGDAVINSLATYVKETKQAQKKDSLILFVLARRDDMSAIRAILPSLSALSLPVSATGPWPPSEFLNCYPDFGGRKETE